MLHEQLFLYDTRENFDLHAAANEAINSIYCKSPLLYIIFQNNTNSGASNTAARGCGGAKETWTV